MLSPSVLVNAVENLREKIKAKLKNPQSTSDVQMLLKEQQQVRTKYISFLKVELGIETIFQIAGK